MNTQTPHVLYIFWSPFGYFVFSGSGIWKTDTRDQLASLFFPFWVILASHDLLFVSNLSSIFSKTSIWLLWHLHTFWESFGSERRVIKEITSLDLFTCPYQVFINNYPGGCIPQLDAGSLIGIRSHLEMHDYIRSKKELLGDNVWLKMGLWRSILFHSERACMFIGLTLITISHQQVSILWIYVT